MLRLPTAILAALFASGCAISQEVEPVPERQAIEKVYVEHNPDVHMEELNDSLVGMFEDMGIESELYRGTRPADAEHHLEFTANWTWDIAMYLTYFDARLYEQEQLIGTAEYDARRGGGRPDKFGPTEEKIRPLMQELITGEPAEE